MTEFTTNLTRFDYLYVRIIDNRIEAKLQYGEEVSHKLLPEEIKTIRKIAQWIDENYY